jgi:hypothetical protein
MTPQIPRQELLFLWDPGWGAFYANPTHSRTEQAGQENFGKNSQRSQRDTRKSLVKDFQRQTFVQKMPVQRKRTKQTGPQYLETEYQDRETLKSGKRLVSL